MLGKSAVNKQNKEYGHQKRFIIDRHTRCSKVYRCKHARSRRTRVPSSPFYSNLSVRGAFKSFEEDRSSRKRHSRYKSYRFNWLSNSRLRIDRTLGVEWVLINPAYARVKFSSSNQELSEVSINETQKCVLQIQMENYLI